jgi:glycogen operon protein
MNIGTPSDTSMNPTSKSELLTIVATEFEVTRGRPDPLGASLARDGVNFAVYSKHATFMALVLYTPEKSEPVAEFPLDDRFNRTGNIWHVFVRGLNPGVEYGWRANGPRFRENPLLRFDNDQVLVDPYSHALTHSSWNRQGDAASDETAENRARRSCVVDDDFDWGDDQPLNRHLADSVICELHVRGFTKHPSSGVSAPGTFRGLIDKIPYLKDLGITAVELMPVTEFDENDNVHTNPLTGDRLTNFWGYHPISFFAPKSSFASCTTGYAHVTEFKTMVKALHEAGIEVILDMVFNHTAEGDENGPLINFRGLDNEVYYILDPRTGAYHNYSGCGNTINCNHPIVRDMIVASLRYWVTEMHVDGFRFDLASVLGRGRDGSVLSHPPLLERIAADPVLANTKLIAEAWDATGLYQVGTFPNWGRWAEWNGKFRDDVRSFVKGDAGMASALATRLCGSPDLYRWSDRAPYHSINFVTSHDGFTLNDLVSYNEKHNIANGENNADGDNHNLSWNCGREGPTSSPKIERLRRRQMRNLAAILLASQGVPMILAGDEMGRTQQGNNNTYCQDNELNWIDWGQLEKNHDLFRFFKEMIAFRKAHPSLRKRTFDGESHWGLNWHGTRLDEPDWSQTSSHLAMHLKNHDHEDDIFVILNSHWEQTPFQLPRATEPKRWHRFVDTSLEAPEEIREVGQEVALRDQHFYAVGSRSVVILIGK